MIVLYSDLDLRGSGYMNITIALADQLASRFNRKVTVLGMGYSGAAHDWPFQIIPVKPAQAFQHASAMLQNLVSLGQAGMNEPVDAFVCLLDIPHQEAVFSWPVIGNRVVPFVGVFPIESGPLCNTWANILSRLDARLVISQYGTDQCSDAGLPATHIPIGLDPDAWRMPVEGEVETLRETMGMEKDDFVVLTVADNQERKNLSCAFRAISILKNKHGIKVKWVLVTRVGSKVGWKLADLANEHDIADVLTTFERGIDHSRLWILNAMADVFLLTSKAEGLCMPVIEAMACGTPVVATNATALMEHLKDTDGKDRGFPVVAKYVYQDPWGNSYRHFADPDSAAKQLKKVFTLQKKGKLGDIISRGRKYAESRSWDIAGDVLESAIQDVTKLHHERALAHEEAAKTKEMFAGGQANIDDDKPLIPPTVPQAVPVMTEKP
jgi:glycosyltransferase involved in cell wall biosynthesis